MFNIRYVSEADVSFWLAMDRHISGNELELKIRDRRGYVIGDGENPAGIMRYNLFWDNTPFLTLIHLKDEYQGKGFGKSAMLHWENEMRGFGYKMTMTSTQVDEQSQHFYRKLGYIDRGGIYFDNTPFMQPQELIMIKIL